MSLRSRLAELERLVRMLAPPQEPEPEPLDDDMRSLLLAFRMAEDGWRAHALRPAVLRALAEDRGQPPDVAAWWNEALERSASWWAGVWRQWREENDGDPAKRERLSRLLAECEAGDEAERARASA